MSLTFLSPLGALLALGVLLPLAALRAVRARSRLIRRTLGLPEPAARSRVAPAVALVVAAALLGLAAAQPVLDRTTTRLIRSDAETFVVIDTSRSMLARRSPGSPSRIERAKDAATRLRASLPGVPVGIASITDRVLPHLFPSADEDVFQATLERAVGIERPPPRGGFLTKATKLGALASVAGGSFFSPAARIRLLVVLTDGESLPVAAKWLGARLRQPPGIETVFVQFWDARERVLTRGVPEPQYRPDLSARSILDGVAAATGGSVYSEGELGSAVRRAHELVGRGPTVAQGERRGRLALAPYLAAATFLPLSLLLRRRDR